MPSSSSGAGLRMEPQSCSLFSLLCLLLLPRPSLLYSLNNCTRDFNDPGIIYCGNKKLTSIPSDVPKSVTYLSLLNNNIKRIRQTDLTGFTRLETLDLANNDISHIEDGAFSDLSALSFFSLFDNKLTVLTDDMFKGLSSLMTLYLGYNQIKSISKFAFEPLNNLQELSLWSNKLFQISDITNIVSHCPSLKILDLGYNEFTVFESDLFPFPLLNLTELDLTSNPLRKFRIHSDVFPFLESLDLLKIRSELQWDVSDKAFLKNLKTLDLSWTEFTLETYQIIFQSVDSVRNLYLRGLGRMTDRGLLDLACGILSLQKLDLSLNGTSVVNDSLLQLCTNLTDLTLTQNSLTESDLSESSLRMLTRLSQLYLGENLLSRVPLAIGNMSTLTNLSLDLNHIRKLQCSDFAHLWLLTELSLGSNNLVELNSCVFKDLKSLKKLHIEDNFLLQFDNNFGISLPGLVVLTAYDNNIAWLQKGIFKNMSCLTDLVLDSVRGTFVEDGAFDGLPNLRSLSYSPSLFRKSALGTTVSSSREELTDYKTIFNLPSLQELTVTVTADVCFMWEKDFLKGLDNLKVFSSVRFFCKSPYLEIFRYTPRLLSLEIFKNVNLSPDPEHFQPIPDLQSLGLSENHLKSLDFLFEANLTKLEKLVLENNDLMVINETVFEALPSLKYLDLSGNPFACNCSNAGFIQWAIRNKQVYVVSAFQYRCSSPLSHEGHFLLDFNVQSCWDLTAFLCFISSSALVLLTLLSSFIYHFLRWQLVYGFYLLLAFLYDSKKRRQGCPHIYDAFVSYNVHDEDWVYGELVPELEGRQGWRLCLHHRDFEPGKPIMENITDAIYSSRKTLCVISRRYLQSEWCSREIQMASFRLFDEQKDVLILLFLEQMSSNQLSPFYRMRKLVKSRTYLSWTQAHSHKGLFWEKVRRALESGNEPGDNHNPLTANV